MTAIPYGPLRWLAVWPYSQQQQQPNVSTLNAATGTVTANAAIVQAGTNGEISVFVTDSSDLAIDINGYFAPSESGALGFYPVTPCRLFDTRQAGDGGTVTASPVSVVEVAGSSCSPASTAQTYVLNATVVPSGFLGYLTVWPDLQAQPYVSTLNAHDGVVTSNMALVPTANGLIDAFATSPTNLILDISGFFAPLQ